MQRNPKSVISIVAEKFKGESLAKILSAIDLIPQELKETPFGNRLALRLLGIGQSADIETFGEYIPLAKKFLEVKDNLGDDLRYEDMELGLRIFERAGQLARDFEDFAELLNLFPLKCEYYEIGGEAPGRITCTGSNANVELVKLCKAILTDALTKIFESAHGFTRWLIVSTLCNEFKFADTNDIKSQVSVKLEEYCFNFRNCFEVLTTSPSIEVYNRTIDKLYKYATTPEQTVEAMRFDDPHGMGRFEKKFFELVKPSYGGYAMKLIINMSLETNRQLDDLPYAAEIARVLVAVIHPEC
jgi:hypothetical protein